MRIEAFGGTHQGRVRPINEDRFSSRPDRGVFLVADGMGGHSHGDLASSAIVHEVDGASYFDDFVRDGETLFDAIVRANTIIRDISRRNDAMVIGSTVAALLISGTKYSVFWTGDSRIYRLRDGVVAGLTEDHTEANMLRRAGRISDEEAANWPRQHVIAHAIGVSPQPHIEVQEGETKAGDAFVLCSDGLTAHVADEEIGILAVGSSPERHCKELVKLALERGGSDNVSVVVVRIEDDG